MPSTSSRLLAVALLAAAPALAAQPAPAVRDVPRPSREIDDPFSLIAAVRELSGNRLVVVDGGDGEVAVVNFSTGARSSLGRQGSGPGEYRAPGAVFRVRGDTLWLLDQGQQRITVFNPDLKAGVPFNIQFFDQTTRSVVTGPFHADVNGTLYGNVLPVGAGGPNMQIPDSVDVLRFDARSPATRSTLARIRFPTSGRPEMRVEGQVIHYSMAFPGLVTADAWVVFPDGRVAIVRGATYTVEFITPDGRRTVSKPVPYTKLSVTAEDRNAEMREAERQLAEQSKAVQRSMPAGFTLNMKMTPPVSWPAEYPAIAPFEAFAAPDGRLWVRRSTPIRLDRQQWDVLDATGTLVARWQLPRRTRLVGVGNGAIYTIRVDEDDLQYVQRIEIGR